MQENPSALRLFGLSEVNELYGLGFEALEMRIVIVIPALVRSGGIPRVVTEESKGPTQAWDGILCYGFVGAGFS